MSGRRQAAALTAAVAATLLERASRAAHWRTSLERTNHAGRTVSLIEGPAYVVGTALGAVPAGPPAVAAVLGSGAFGALDDLRGDSSSKGLKGHLGALAHGEVTTGALKILGIGLTGVVAAALADRGKPRSGSLAGRTSTTVVGGAVVALGANLGNLLDLRPGRALKAGVLVGAPLLVAAGDRPAVAAAASLGASAALLPADLAGQTMLGDTGANALGAVLATAFVQRSGARGRLLAASALLALTVASERVSFTEVIESTPVLRELDRWGRTSR